MAGLSVAIITLNESAHIGRCLSSVEGLASEVVVVDSGSTDDTERICREHGARFIHHPFEGHIQQKQYALSQCTNDVVLSLDADEALSAELRDSIAGVLTEMPNAAFEMSRMTSYCGTWIRHGAWYPDRKVRLFRRDAGRWAGINPHDRFEVMPSAGPVGRLRGDILHYSYADIGQHLRQIDAFTRISAEQLHQMGRKAPLWRIVLAPPVRFVRDFVLRAGFLDGLHGLVIAVLSSCAVFVKYVRLRHLSRNDHAHR